jgi:hypothetical protein
LSNLLRIPERKNKGLSVVFLQEAGLRTRKQAPLGLLATCCFAMTTIGICSLSSKLSVTSLPCRGHDLQLARLYKLVYCWFIFLFRAGEGGCCPAWWQATHGNYHNSSTIDIYTDKKSTVHNLYIVDSELVRFDKQFKEKSSMSISTIEQSKYFRTQT